MHYQEILNASNLVTGNPSLPNGRVTCNRVVAVGLRVSLMQWMSQETFSISNPVTGNPSLPEGRVACNRVVAVGLRGSLTLQSS